MGDAIKCTEADFRLLGRLQRLVSRDARAAKRQALIAPQRNDEGIVCVRPVLKRDQPQHCVASQG